MIPRKLQLCFLTLCLVMLFTMKAKAQIPSVMIKTLDAKDVKLDTLSNGGKPIIVSFFATWCKPCLRELQAIHELYEEWQVETGVKLIAVSIDEGHNVQKVKPLVDEHGWTFDVLLDTNRDLMRALGAKMVPYSVIIDGNGKIVDRHSGYTDGYEHTLIEKIRKIAQP